MHVCIFIYVEHRAALYTQCRLPALLQHRMYTYICVICISYVYVYILHFHNMYIICTYLNICIYLYIVIIARHCVQCAAVCCSVLQCVAVCCSVLQCAAVCCSVLQCAAEHRGVWHTVCSKMSKKLTFDNSLQSVARHYVQCAAVCCSVLQCVAVCCRVLHCVAV